MEIQFSEVTKVFDYNFVIEVKIVLSSSQYMPSSQSIETKTRENKEPISTDDS